MSTTSPPMQKNVSPAFNPASSPFFLMALLTHRPAHTLANATKVILVIKYIIMISPSVGALIVHDGYGQVNECIYNITLVDKKVNTCDNVTDMNARRFQVITLFPEMLTGVFENSMMWKAQKDAIVSLETINLRDFGIGTRKVVDDTPYGGGDGMLLRPEPLWKAVMQAKANDPGAKVLLMTPRGERWTQAEAKAYSETDSGYIFVCGRYEGYDERILELVDAELSVGDYVLTGGELPAMTIIDSIVRLLPGVLGGESSAEIESFSDGETLEFPQYTRPADFEGRKVPDVLLSGNHGEIAKWRAANSKKA